MKGFHHGVVEAVSFAAHAYLYPPTGEQLPVGLAGVLPPPIRMMQEARIWLALGQGHAQRSMHETVITGSSHRPTDNQAAVDIQDQRHVQPAFLCPHSGHVGDPFFIKVAGREIAGQRVGSDGIRMLAVRGAAAMARALGTERSLAHQPLSSAAYALCMQLRMHPQTAVRVTAAVRDALDLLPSLPILLLPLTRLAPLPGRIATRRHRQGSAPMNDGIGAGELDNDGVPHGWFPREKIALVFLGCPVLVVLRPARASSDESLLLVHFDVHFRERRGLRAFSLADTSGTARYRKSPDRVPPGSNSCHSSAPTERLHL